MTIHPFLSDTLWAFRPRLFRCGRFSICLTVQAVCDRSAGPLR